MSAAERRIQCASPISAVGSRTWHTKSARLVDVVGGRAGGWEKSGLAAV